MISGSGKEGYAEADDPERTDCGGRECWPGVRQSAAAVEPPKQDEQRSDRWNWFHRQTDRKKKTALRKTRLLMTAAKLADVAGETRAAEMIASREGVHLSTIYRWKKAVQGFPETEWPPLLCSGQKGYRKRKEYTETAFQWFRKDYLAINGPKFSQSYERTRLAAEEHGWEIPSLATMRRRFRECVSPQEEILMREGRKALLERYPKQKRDKSMLRAMQWVNGDGWGSKSGSHIRVRFPDGDELCPKIWFWQDVYSNMIVGWRIDKSENQDMLRLAFLDMAERYGLPETLTVDNTTAAANKFTTGKAAKRFRFKASEDDAKGVFVQLLGEGNVKFSMPGYGWAKPIERAFGIGGVSKYIEHDPKLRGNQNAKGKYMFRIVTLAQFKKIVANNVAIWNQKRGRRSDLCAGVLSYQELFEQSFQNYKKKTITNTQREMLLLKAENVKVDADGTFRMEAGKGFGVGVNRYGSEDHILFRYAGKKIQVYFDPMNLHAPVSCHTPDGRFLCHADCPLTWGGF